MELNAQQQSDLRKVIKVLDKFNQISQQMQVSTMLTLLHMAEFEAKGKDWSMQDIEKAVGLMSGTSSRNVYYWATGARGVNRAMDFVRIGFDPSDRRKRSITFTNVGKAFVEKVINVLKGPS